MSRQYWISSDGRVSGPFSPEQLVRMARGGGLRAEDLVSADQEKWTPAGQIKGLIRAAAPGPGPAGAAAPESVPAEELVAAAAAARAAPPEQAPGVTRAGVPVAGAPPVRRRRKAPLVVLAVVLGALLIGGAAFGIYWFTRTRVPSKPFAYAPPGADVMVHVDVAELADYFIQELRKGGPTGAAGLAMLLPLDVDTLEAFSKKIDSVDLFAILQGIEKQPLMLVALRGSVTMADIRQLAVSFGEEEELPLASRGNGRYDIAQEADTPMLAIFGDKAADLPQGVVLFGSPELLSADGIRKLGTDKNLPVRPLLHDVDTTAPIWGAGRLPAELGPEAPETVAAHLDPRGDVRAEVRMGFRTTAVAQQVEQAIAQTGTAMFPIPVKLKASRKGRVVVVTVGQERGLLEMLLATVVQSRQGQQVAQKSMSQANLNAIGAALKMYEAEHDGKAPKHLGELVQAASIEMEQLISPLGETATEGWDAAAGSVPNDYVYLPIPTSKAPGDLIRVYEQPTFHGGKGTQVLRVSGTVEFLPMAQFQAELARSRQWLSADQPSGDP